MRSSLSGLTASSFLGELGVLNGGRADGRLVGRCELSDALRVDGQSCFEASQHEAVDGFWGEKPTHGEETRSDVQVFLQREGQVAQDCSRGSFQRCGGRQRDELVCLSSVYCASSGPGARF